MLCQYQLFNRYSVNDFRLNFTLTQCNCNRACHCSDSYRDSWDSYDEIKWWLIFLVVNGGGISRWWNGQGGELGRVVKLSGGEISRWWNIWWWNFRWWNFRWWNIRWSIRQHHEEKVYKVCPWMKNVKGMEKPIRNWTFFRDSHFSIL